ncbi:FMN-binding negative transcriptional regulator [Paucibacter sp. B2R-40]|uniref:FMN-binding negative transcriptional regulator n=1 Tax=Paucibacter sp. B2R-40 TaxID=2893554 RepID=UPI0021E44DE7|nr:FMN-binding negative transcriptional regulator [Paucibacter sp. B2R-40]MCV2353037.1 FMN-binding negative transcriptional regulator [Paucibacter sp. B2R-40]
MYMPAHFASKDFANIGRMITLCPLALLIGPDADGQSFGSHLPLNLLDESSARSGCDILLEGHMARANPHWGWLAGLHAQGKDVMAVFSGPGAYVSPRHYDSQLAVPTWNYAAVHVYGELELIDDAQAKDALLKRLIAQHEPGYAAQWRDLPDDFQAKMLGAIVGFRLHIRRWEGKFKLSQNRSAVERGRIRDAMLAGSAAEQDIGAWMAHLGL